MYAEPKDGGYAGPEDGVWFVRAVLEIVGLLCKRDSKKDRCVEWVGFMNGGRSGARAMAIPQSSLAEFLLLQGILFVLLPFFPYKIFCLPWISPPPPQNTVQFEYLYNSALRPQGQRLFSLLCPFFFSHPSWKIMKSFLIQLLFTGGCWEHASFSYQRLTRPNRCPPPLLPLPLSLPLPRHMLNYLFWRDLSSFRWSGWAISLDILHGHK